MFINLAYEAVSIVITRSVLSSVPFLLHQEEEEEDFIADTLSPLSLTDYVSWQGGKEGK